MTSATVLSGRSLAHDICQRIKAGVAILKSEFNISPKLSVIEVGKRRDSTIYVKRKRWFALQCGVELSHIRLPSSSSTNAILKTIQLLNNDPNVHGIALQLPLDSDHDFDVVYPLHTISTEKDVEGLGAVNTALVSREISLLSSRSIRLHIPCTAAACLALVRSINFPLKGTHCVVVGRGRLVGAPTADLLSGLGGATVTLCHIYSRNLPDEVSRADLVVSATGSPGLIRGAWIKPGAVVLDCGYSVVQDSIAPSKLRSVGDVRFDEAIERAGWITPVPGGVGPLSVAMLFLNTLNSARWAVGLEGVDTDLIDPPA
ncbi:unnamed protein product, partial [Dicrocoelium dendriticum]